MNVANPFTIASTSINLQSKVFVYTTGITYNNIGESPFPTNAKLFEIIVFGGGAGGSSAARAGNTSYATGGTGGGGGGYASITIPASQVTYPLTITVGSGGTGGAARGPALALPGLTGTNGNSSCFGGDSSCVGSYITAPGGTAGTPPTATQAAGTRVAGTGGYTSFLKGGNGVVGGDAGPANAALANCSMYGGGGGGSGGYGANPQTTGLYYGGIGSYIRTAAFGNGGSASSGSAGGNGTSRSGTGFAGDGGGGGAGRNTASASAYAGGNGGVPGGGAGGGGVNVSTSTNTGTLSGKGGDGGRGEVIVIAYY